jgi:hypothetical protein
VGKAEGTILIRVRQGVLVLEIRRFKRAIVKSRGNPYPSQARVIYCQLLKSGTNAVGFQLETAHLD